MVKLVEKPTPHQIARGVLLGKQMHQESIYRVMRFDERRVLRIALSANKKKHGPVLVLAVDDDDENDVVGFMLGSITPHYFSEENVASDYALFVKKDKRGSMAAVRLVKAFEKMAIRRGASIIMIGAATGINPEMTEKFYERLGYPKVGSMHAKVVEK